MMFHVKADHPDPLAHVHEHLTHLEETIMATLAQINDALAAQASAATALAAAVQVSIQSNVEPAALDAPLAQITANTQAIQEATTALSPAPATPAAPTA